MDRLSLRISDFLCRSGHVLVSDPSAADVEIRLNGCPTSCLDEENPGRRVISVSAANIDLSAPDDGALIQWVCEEIRRMAACP